MINQISTALKTYRENSNLTQSDMSKLLDVSEPYYENVERGKVIIDVKTLKKFSKLSSLSYELLIYLRQQLLSIRR